MSVPLGYFGCAERAKTAVRRAEAQEDFLKEVGRYWALDKEENLARQREMTSQGCFLSKVSLILQKPDAILTLLSTSLTRDQRLKIKKSSFARIRQLRTLGLG